MSLNSEQTCPDCGAAILAAAPEGLCPRCLLVAGFQSPAPANPTAVAPTSERAGPPSRTLGDYELIEEIARGGMGVVYRARQISLNRVVALKLLLFGRFASEPWVRRFRAEAEAAASLHHANIVPIYDVGEEDGQHYFSMELVEGQSLAELVRDNPLPAREAARHLKTIAEAVEHAHRRGILHRDLKPSNVLFDAGGQIRITDFGLAKRVEPPPSLAAESGAATGSPLSKPDPHLTLTGQVLGSPSYMPPEQADPNRGSPGPAGDVYSLGAILYHLLTGRPPFLAETFEETLSHLLIREPVAPRLLNPGIPRDLETICLKCLEKEPARRYPAAGHLADELERFLNDRPILARPGGTFNRLARWARRQPVVAGSLCVVFLALVTVTLVSTMAARRVARAGRTAEIERAVAVQASLELGRANEMLAANVNRLELQLAEERFQAGDVSAGLAHLAAVVRRDPSNRLATARLFSALVHRDFPLPATPAITGPGKVVQVEFSADSRRLLVLRQNPLTRRNDNSVQIWDASSSQPLSTPIEHSDSILWTRFSHDGKRVVTASADHTARLWDGSTGRALTAPLQHGAAVRQAKFSPDSSRVLTITDERMAHLWSAVDGRLITEWTVHSTPPTDAGFSPDGRLIVTASVRGSVRLWSADTGAEAREFFSGTNLVTGGAILSVQFSPDGRSLLTVGADNAARLWDLRTGGMIGESMKHTDRLGSARFSPDGNLIVTASHDRTVRLWDGRTGRTAARPFQHPDVVTDVQFSPDGRQLVTGSWDNTAHLWDVATGQEACGPFRFTERVETVAFSHDGQRVATGSEDGIAQVWDIRPSAARELRVEHGRAVAFATFSPAGASFVTASDDGTARVWDALAGRPLSPILRHERPVLKADFSSDGRLLVTASEDYSARVWELPEGRLRATLRHQGRVLSAHFDPGGRRVVTASRDGSAQVWDSASGQSTAPALRHDAWVREARFSPDGALVATAGFDRTARVWDSGTGKLITALPHADYVQNVTFSPDGRLIATASMDNTGRLWNARTGEAVGAPLNHPRGVFEVTFSPDGTRVVTAAWDRTARVWDSRTGAPLSEPMQHDDQVWAARFSPDGQRVVTASLDDSARVWDASTGRPVSEPLRHGGKVYSARFSPDGQRVLTASDDGSARIWDVPPLPVPAPVWLPDLAEALGGLRLDEQRRFVFAGRDSLRKVRAREPPADKGVLELFRLWFFTNREDRPPSPLSQALPHP